MRSGVVVSVAANFVASVEDSGATLPRSSQHFPGSPPSCPYVERLCRALDNALEILDLSCKVGPSIDLWGYSVEGAQLQLPVEEARNAVDGVPGMEGQDE